jgi:hypothetical protein
LTLGFATVAFSFLYLVFRYNLFYVLYTSIDTQGRAYALALQQLTVGVYTCELCLIGLFSISAKRHGGSFSPLILMVLFTILTVVYHRIMHKELDPLTKTLPRAITHRHELEQGYDSDGSETGPLLGESRARELPSGMRGVFIRFLEPQKYASFAANYKALVATRLGEPVPSMSEKQEEEAYLPPAQKAKSPTLWIAKDETGVSRREMESMPEQLMVTDEGAWITPSGKVQFDKLALRDLPVWKSKLYY